MSVGNLTAYLGLDDTGFVRGMARATASMNSVSRTLNNIGQSMTTMITLPLLALGGAAVKSSMDFEKAFSEMEGLVGLAREEVIGFRKEILAMAGETSRAPQELAEALRFVTSSGFEGASALEVVRISAKGAAAGLGDTQSLADLVTDAMNSYGHANLSAARSMDILTEAVAQGKGEPKEMAAAIGYVLPIASQLGVEFEEVAAAVAFMTRLGADASTAATNLRQMFSDILDPSKQAQDTVKDLGTNFEFLRKTLKERGTLAVLGYLKESMKGNREEFTKLWGPVTDVKDSLGLLKVPVEENSHLWGQLFGNVRSLTAGLALTGVQANVAQEVFGAVAEKTGQLNRAFNTAANTSTFKFNQAMAELKVAGIELGDALMPIFLDFIDVVKGVVRWFSTLSEEGKRMTIIIAGIAAAAGPVLLVLGSVASIFALISAKVLLVVASVAALGLGFLYLHKNWEAIKERISDWEWWKQMFRDMGQWLSDNNPFAVLQTLFEESLMALAKYMAKTFGKHKSPREVLEDAAREAEAQAQLDKILQKNKEMGGPEPAKVEKGTEAVKEYKTEFVSMKDIVVEGWQDMTKWMKDHFAKLADFAGVGKGTGWAASTPEEQIAAPAKKDIKPIKMPVTIDRRIFQDTFERDPAIRERLVNPMREANQVLDQLNQAFESMIENTIVQLGEGIAQLFTGEISAGEFFQGLLGTIAEFLSMLGKALIAAGVASEAFKNLFGNPFAAIAAGAALIVLAGVVKGVLKAGPGGGGKKAQGLASGGYVTSGGVFQLHKKELVSLPMGSAVTPAHMARGGGGNGGGKLSTEINLRKLIIQLDRERERMGR